MTDIIWLIIVRFAGWAGARGFRCNAVGILGRGIRWILLFSYELRYFLNSTLATCVCVCVCVCATDGWVRVCSDIYPYPVCVCVCVCVCVSEREPGGGGGGGGLVNCMNYKPANCKDIPAICRIFITGLCQFPGRRWQVRSLSVCLS